VYDLISLEKIAQSSCETAFLHRRDPRKGVASISISRVATIYMGTVMSSPHL